LLYSKLSLQNRHLVKAINKLLLLASFILLMPLYGIANRISPNISKCTPGKTFDVNYRALLFLDEYKFFFDTSGTAREESAAFNRAIKKQQKAFKVYPNPASNIVYLRISGRQTITLHNASDSLIFRTSIREKALVNIKKLPVGTYYFRDEKTGIIKEIIIAR
jgi:hypothetical protein